MIYSGVPQGRVEVPACVVGFAGGRPVRPVWLNGTGGLTFEVGAGAGRQFVKWAPAGSGVELSAELARLRWAARYAVVPAVVAEGADASGSWIATDGLPGRSAVDGRWLADPATAVRVIGEGLRVLHDALPVADCPFDWSAEARVARAHARVSAGVDDPASRVEEAVGEVGGVERALELLAAVPPVEHPVVCHGDACAPNTLLADDGSLAGHVDLGSLGVADRWADLAVATWNTRWNYGPGWERALLDGYGVDPDPERIRYYRLLWELT
ncbi:aminoglycoside 3'-phosphotransferase [Kitasatospora terrestris]|uniref:Aminoglycoside 3'-phosphotransferase n=1 Tax=Kitasatospora terrestris TaxID=258051 RepID=A0ABP9DSY5_9ACTN